MLAKPKHKSIKVLSIKVLLSKTLINSATRYDEFVLIDNVLKEYNEWKKKLKIWWLSYASAYWRI